MADSIHVKLPDGSVKEVPKGTTALDIAKSISPRLADAALVAQISSNGDQAGDGARTTLIDLTKPLEKDTDLRLLTERDPEALEVYRHSSAHLLCSSGVGTFSRDQARSRTPRPRPDFSTTSTGQLRSRPRIWKRSKRKCRNWFSRMFLMRASFCRATRDWPNLKKKAIS